MKTVGLLTISNIFMTFAWYGHLKFRDVSLWKVVLVSWLIAFFEYLFSGTREQDRVVSVLRRTTKNYPGSHYSRRVQRLLGSVS